jgi:hypothetical protein
MNQPSHLNYFHRRIIVALVYYWLCKPKFDQVFMLGIVDNFFLYEFYIIGLNLKIGFF